MSGGADTTGSTTNDVVSRYDVDRAALGALLDGEPGYRVQQVWEGLYQHLGEPESWTALPKGLRQRLTDALPSALTLDSERVSDNGDTIKSLWRLADGQPIESVLMIYRDRATVCISSQAGCAMGCGFCATGQAGFARHLTVGEIVEQVVRATERARSFDRRLSNVVFMGMGEPLANLGRVWDATERIHDDLGLSARSLTISTVGIVPGIRDLGHRDLPVNLAVSLHAANDRLRDELVPINRRYPIADLIDACGDYLARKRRRLSFEWALIDGVNDRDVDADELADLTHQLRPRAHVNLIPLNPTPGYPTIGSPMRRVHAFRDRLEAAGVNATVRSTRGSEIAAACGQLAAERPIAVSSPRRRPTSMD